MTASATRTWNGLTIPAPGIYLLDQAHKRIGFVARHMMVSPVRGEFREATARIVVAEDPFASSVTATIQTASIDTANPERDAHLSSPDFLDVERFPTLEYRSTGIKWQGNNDPIFFWARLRNNRLTRHNDAYIRAAQQPAGTTTQFVLTGELTVKGITRPVDLQVSSAAPGATRTTGTSSDSARPPRSTVRTTAWCGTSSSKAEASSSGRMCGSRSRARRSARPGWPQPWCFCSDPPRLAFSRHGSRSAPGWRC